MHDYISPAEADILAERARQIKEEGWTHEHDDAHREGEMALAAMCYCMAAGVAARVPATEAQYKAAPAAQFWPWHKTWWKPKNPRRDLVRAAALIIAEIERLDRMAPGKL